MKTKTIGDFKRHFEAEMGIALEYKSEAEMAELAKAATDKESIEKLIYSCISSMVWQICHLAGSDDTILTDAENEVLCEAIDYGMNNLPFG